MQEPQILNVLNDAKFAHQAGDFLNALKFYERFFDDALNEDPEAMYSLRLYMCLDGWAALANEFPGAKKRLHDKQIEALTEYKREKEPERFHDYVQISLRLNSEQEAVQQFLEFHKQSPKSAAKLSKFIWELLLRDQQWEVCNALLPEPSMKMDELFAVFDEANKLKDVNPMFNNLRFEQHTIDELFVNLESVIAVLRSANRKEEINKLERQFVSGVEHRNNLGLSKRSTSQRALLFSIQ